MVAGMQTDQPVPPSDSLQEPFTNTHPVSHSPHDPGLDSYVSGSEADDEQP